MALMRRVLLRKNRRVRGFTESLKEIGYQGIRRGDIVIQQDGVHFMCRPSAPA